MYIETYTNKTPAFLTNNTFDFTNLTHTMLIPDFQSVHCTYTLV